MSIQKLSDLILDLQKYQQKNLVSLMKFMLNVNLS